MVGTAIWMMRTAGRTGNAVSVSPTLRRLFFGVLSLYVNMMVMPSILGALLAVRPLTLFYRLASLNLPHLSRTAGT